MSSHGGVHQTSTVLDAGHIANDGSHLDAATAAVSRNLLEPVLPASQQGQTGAGAGEA